MIQTDHEQCEGEDKGFSHTPSLSSHCAYNCLQERVNLCYYMVIIHTTLSIVNNGTPRFTDLLLFYSATLTKKFSNFGIKVCIHPPRSYQEVLWLESQLENS